MEHGQDSEIECSLQRLISMLFQAYIYYSYIHEYYMCRSGCML